MNPLYPLLKFIINFMNSSSSKQLYDKTGHLLSDDTDRCDCNRLICSGCFFPCASCQSPKCGLECRMYYNLKDF